MAIASLRVPISALPQVDTGSWLSGLADTLGGGIQELGKRKSFGKLADLIKGQEGAATVGQQAIPSTAGTSTYTAPVTPVERGPVQKGSTYQPFIETVRAGGLTNPYGLAAVAATGRAESGWSAGNANRTWSDPSESGQAGTAGGILSWRGPRYQALAATGDLSPEGQARFFLQENPQLIAQLNNAKSPEEAADIMANAWKFAGYNRQGGEAERRRALARNYYAQEFSGQPNDAASAIEAVSPTGGFDSGRFGDVIMPAQGRDQLASALTQTNMEGIPTADTTQGNPVQVADASGAMPAGSNMLAQGVTPIQRGGVDPSIIQMMLRDPNLREYGVKLWQQSVTGGTGEPWQFVTLPDGTLARANQQTGSVERIGNFARNQDYQVLSQEERAQYGIPTEDRRIYQRGPNGQISAVGGAGQTINVGNEVDARRQAAAQAGLTEEDPAYQGFILTGKLPRENEQTLTATDKKAILEADEMVLNAQNVLPLLNRALELNDVAYDGLGASERGSISGAFGSDAGQATIELENNVLAGALGQLKAIFGAAPTEGERKILLDVEGAVNRPASVRKAIFERAKAAAERRMTFYQARASDLRGGQFYRKSDGATGKGNRTSSGVKWEIVE